MNNRGTGKKVSFAKTQKPNVSYDSHVPLNFTMQDLITVFEEKDGKIIPGRFGGEKMIILDEEEDGGGNQVTGAGPLIDFRRRPDTGDISMKDYLDHLRKNEPDGLALVIPGYKEKPKMRLLIQQQFGDDQEEEKSVQKQRSRRKRKSKIASGEQEFSFEQETL